MNQQTAIEILNQWLDLLDEIERVEIDCETSPEHLTANLDRRQQSINQIQQLDASLKSVRAFRFSKAPDLDEATLDDLMEEGKRKSKRIANKNAQPTEITKEKHSAILGKLKIKRLSKGYLASNQAFKIRPPAILDGNA